MNIFGAFTFGSLIKTFLPGFVWLIAIAMLEGDISRLHGVAPVILGYAAAHDQSALVLAIPTAILLGLLSNIIVFLGVNDWLVRDPVRAANPGLFTLHDRLATKLRERCWDGLAWTDGDLRRSFDRFTDAELIMLPEIGVDRLSYVREQYWYHLEFQVNLLLSVVVIFAAATISAALSGQPVRTFLLHTMVYLVLAGLACALLRHAARKNYQRHIAKMLSLMAAVLGDPPPAEES
jgi:hypothetical protein